MMKSVPSGGPEVLAPFKPTNPELVDAVVRYANCELPEPRLLTEKWLDELFDPYVRLTQWIQISPSPKTDQRRLRKWLDAMYAGDVDDIRNAVVRAMGKIRAEGFLEEQAEPRMIMWWLFPQFDSFKQVGAFCMASVIHEGLHDRIKICKLEDCHNYFIDWPGKRGRAGQAQFYCSKVHASRARQRRFRQRHAR